MAEEKNAGGQAKGSGAEKLYTLTEVAEKTQISMPTLQRYKKNYQNRIPSVGKGRRQRYPAAALPVFEQIKEENIQRRGRPPKKEGARKAGGRRAAKKAPTKKKGEGLLTLTAVSEMSGISYPTLVRYVKLHGDRIPYEGRGRSRRYHPEAVEVFKQLRAESPRGRRKKSERGAAKPRRGRAAVTTRAAGGRDGDLTKRVAALERAQGNLEGQIRELIKQLKKPLRVTIKR